MIGEFKLSDRNIRNFFAKVVRKGVDECWLWTGALSGDGRPMFGVDERSHAASHIALILDGRPRPAPPNHHALHGDCSNPLCVNPRHLRWGTNAENVADKRRLGRDRYLRGQECPNAKLDENVVRMIRSSDRTGLSLAAELGVSTATISLIRNRRIWAHVS